MKTRNIISYFLQVCTLLLLSGCETVHEFPETFPATEQTVEIRFCFKEKNTLEDYKTINYRYNKSVNAVASHQSRFVVEVYDKNKCLVHTELFSDVDYDEEQKLQLQLPTNKDYCIVAWVDKVNPLNKIDMYYQTASLSEVILNRDLKHACVDQKEAFAGVLNVSLGTALDGANVVSHTVDLYRPHAKFKIITTDLDVYNRMGHKPPQSVKLIYPENLPSLYYPQTLSITNNDSSHEAWGTVSEFTENTCTLAFDWIFCPRDEIMLPVAFEIYDEDQKRIMRSPRIDIPLMRNKLTTVKDRFLTTKFNDGIGIDDGFEGEITIEF